MAVTVHWKEAAAQNVSVTDVKFDNQTVWLNWEVANSQPYCHNFTAVHLPGNCLNTTVKVDGEFDGRANMQSIVKTYTASIQQQIFGIPSN